jgi:hypothetical protein
MEFQPDWSKVQSLWNFLKSVIQLILYDSTKSDLISMAGIELVENAVKYILGNDIDNKNVFFRLRSVREQNKVTIRVENLALKKDIEKIKQSVNRIMAEDNKRKIYLQKLLEIAKKDIEEETMELGILRVIAEANAEVLIESPKENIMSVKAIFNVKRKL